MATAIRMTTLKGLRPLRQQQEEAEAKAKAEVMVRTRTATRTATAMGKGADGFRPQGPVPVASRRCCTT